MKTPEQATAVAPGAGGARAVPGGLAGPAVGTHEVRRSGQRVVADSEEAGITD